MSPQKPPSPPLTLETIHSLLKQIDGKKENLKKAYEELQSSSPSLTPSLSLSWEDLNAHFSTVQHSLTHQFHLLQSLHSSQTNNPSSSDPGHRVDPNGNITYPVEVSGRVELRALCERMDGKGLTEYVNDHWKERNELRVELVDAMRCAVDPAALVLYAVERFWGVKEAKRGCGLLLETLAGMENLKVSDEVRERARNLALQWKEKMAEGNNRVDILRLLFLIVGYRLGPELLSLDEVADCLIVARPRMAPKLCRVAGLEKDKIVDIIGKLLIKNKLLLAMRFVLEFKLTNEFPPVHLLKSYTQKVAKKANVDGKNSLRAQRNAISQEVGALKAVLRVIEEHGSESEYLKVDLEMRIQQLEKQKVDTKFPAMDPIFKPQQQRDQSKRQKRLEQQQLQSGNNHAKITASVGPGADLPLQKSYLETAGLLPDHPAPHLRSVAVVDGLSCAGPIVAPHMGGTLAGTPQSKRQKRLEQQQLQSGNNHAKITAPIGPGADSPLQKSYLEAAGLLPDHPAPHLRSVAVVDDLSGPGPIVAPRMGGTLAGTPTALRGNLSSTDSQLHSSDFYRHSGYYDRQIAYGGYGALQQYHPSNYHD